MFLEEGVDVVILEVGVGGRLDATNCVPKPVVCGVTSLGFDHMELLGHTLPVSTCIMLTSAPSMLLVPLHCSHGEDAGSRLPVCVCQPEHRACVRACACCGMASL